jgi:phosphopentomutase
VLRQDGRAVSRKGLDGGALGNRRPCDLHPVPAVPARIPAGVDTEPRTVHRPEDHRQPRGLCAGTFCVGRVIARPFTGKPGSFKRTTRRKDFSCSPPQPTLLDNVKTTGLPVVGIGKVDDLFAGRGFTETHHSVVNAECVRLTIEAMEHTEAGLLFTNLVQFDMDWGHRNDPVAFAAGLREFDDFLPSIIDHLDRRDLLFMTADHGNDPTTPSTDHSREYVPLLALGPGFKQGVDLGTRPTFADLGQTAAEFLQVKPTSDGASFLELIR